MDGAQFVDAVRTAKATELDRLGSEKALVATTNARLDREQVLATTAAAERRAEDTFRAWAADEPTPEARDAFEDVAEEEAAHRDRVAAAMGASPDEDVEADMLHDHLRGVEGTPERVAAGLVGRPLASARTLLQVVNFFVNEADAQAADLFRDLRADTEAMTDRGAILLETVCETDAEWDRAREAATETVQVAYDQYAGTLREMGLDPKPVC
ncbi:MAG: hypothetical protein ABEJ06_00825 [Haloarculaceae archaeon]